MAEFKSIPVAEIVVPERIRPVDEDHAKAIAASISSEGLLNPITVRNTPNAKGGKYTLVAGAHRLRAIEINGAEAIDAVLVKADKDSALLLEVAENLFRNELSVIDRAVFVQTYRELWEKQHGEITRGGDRGNQYTGGKGSSLPFAKHVADRIGLSKEAVKLLNRISQNLNPDLRNALRGTAIADNQAQLLKLAKLEPSQQRKAAIAVKETEGDFKRTIALISDRPIMEETDLQGKIFSRLIEAWDQASPETRAAFDEYRAKLDAKEVAA